MPVEAVERDGKVRIVEKKSKKLAKFRKTGKAVDGGGYPTTAEGWKAAGKKAAAINHNL